MLPQVEVGGWGSVVDGGAWVVALLLGAVAAAVVASTKSGEAVKRGAARPSEAWSKLRVL